MVNNKLKTVRDLKKFLSAIDDERPLCQVITVTEYDRDIFHNQNKNFEANHQDKEINIMIYDELYEY